MSVFLVYPVPTPCSITGDSTPPPDISPNPQLSPLNTPPHSPADTGIMTIFRLLGHSSQAATTLLSARRLTSSFIFHLLAEATAQSTTWSWTSRLGNLLGRGVTLIRGLFNLTSDHPTPEMPATTQPVTVTTTPQSPAQERTGMHLVIPWYYY